MLRLYERHIMIHISRRSPKPRKQRNAVRSHVRAPQTLLELDYPSGYCGQELGDDYIFISDSGGKAMMMKALAPFDYLQKFAEEVALEHSDRAQQYLKALRAGQRFVWTFADDDVALLSLVVLLPIGPRTVMCISTKKGFVDAGGGLDYLAEFTTRGAIEMQVGTSNFCK